MSTRCCTGQGGLGVGTRARVGVDSNSAGSHSQQQVDRKQEEQRRQERQHEARARAQEHAAKEYQRQLPFRRMLTSLYEQHNPAKLDELEDILRYWRGREDQMQAKLRQLYPRYFSDAE